MQIKSRGKKKKEKSQSSGFISREQTRQTSPLVLSASSSNVDTKKSVNSLIKVNNIHVGCSLRLSAPGFFQVLFRNSGETIQDQQICNTENISLH